MNTSTKHFLPRIISAVIAVLLALTVAVPAMGAATEGENLTITIKNNKGLPAMSKDMFAVYQLFKGTPQKDGDAGENDWGATSWNNYVLADIEWGASVTKPAEFLNALQKLDEDWTSDEHGKLFDTVKTAADLANVLVGKDNEFMQHFAKFLVNSKQLTALNSEQITETVYNDDTDHAKDTLTYKVKDAGYYLLAETGDHSDEHGEVNDAESEYIIAVLGNQTINLKASIPTVRKYIKIDKDTKAKGTSADINEKITFVIEGTLPKNYGDFVDGYEYIFHDYLADSFTIDKDPLDTWITVTITTGETTYTLTTDQFAVNASGTSDDSKINYAPCSQEIDIADLKELEGKEDVDGNEITITDKSVIRVEYNVILNEKATLGNTGNNSKATLQYSNDPNDVITSSNHTNSSNVYVYTYGLDLKKIGSDSAHSTGLGGAGFLLYKTDSTGKKTFCATFDTLTDSTSRKVIGYRFKGWANAETVDKLIENYNVAKEAYDNASNDSRTNSGSTENTALNSALDALKVYLLNSSNAEGEIGVIPDITGIAADTYALKEVVTPAGYNTMADFNLKIEEKLTEATGILERFTYTSDTNTLGTTYSASSESDVFNNGLIPDTLTNIKAPLLPFTGGIGTVIFYVLGGALVAGAIVYIIIIAKKRRKETENSDK